MFSPYEVETLARLRREEVARQVAANRLASEATKTTRGNPTPRPWRQYLATALRAAAARLAPTTVEPAAEPKPLVT